MRFVKGKFVVHKSCRAKRVERHVEHVKVCRRLFLSNRLLPTLRVFAFYRPVWLGGAVVKAFDLRLKGREFKSQPLRCRVQLWTSCSHTLSSASGVTTLMGALYTGWPQKVSHSQESSLNRIKNRQCGYIYHQFRV